MSNNLYSRNSNSSVRKGSDGQSPQQIWQSAVSAYQTNSPKKARKLLSKLIHHPGANGNTFLLAGLVEYQLLNWHEAEKYLLRAVRELPNQTDAKLALANTYQNMGSAEQALPYYQEVVVAEPENFQALQNLGVAYEDTGRALDALESYDQSLRINSDYELALRSRAPLLGHLGRVNDAVADYEALIERFPDDFELKLDYAELLEKFNLIDKSKSLISKLSAANHNVSDNISRARVAALNAQFLIRQDDFQGALNILEKAEKSTGQKYLKFKQGMLLDRFGSYAEAMECFKQANRFVSKHKKFNKVTTGEVMQYLDDKILRGIPSSQIEADSLKRNPPVFVVGLPRSGTTLLNRILNAHPDIQVVEEISALRSVETALSQGATDEEGEKLYWDIVRQHIKVNDDALLIDKSPYHPMSLDVVSKVFPQSKVIFAMRHPYDSALSCFMQDFRPGPVNANFLELKSSARLCSKFLRLMRLFEQARPAQVSRVYYEKLVSDFRPEVIRLLAILGLDWHEDIERYDSVSPQSGSIMTSSYEQVTRKIYNSAVNRWRNYEEWIGEFDPELQPMLEEFDYRR